MSLVPCIRSGIALGSTYHTLSSREAPNKWPDEDAQLVRRLFPAIDYVVAERLHKALSWRRSRILGLSELPELPLQTTEQQKRKNFIDRRHVDELTGVALSMTKRSIDGSLKTILAKVDNVQAQESTLKPSQDEGGVGSSSDLPDGTSVKAQPNEVVDMSSISGAQSDTIISCPICCVIISAASWKFVLSTISF